MSEVHQNFKLLWRKAFDPRRSSRSSSAVFGRLTVSQANSRTTAAQPDAEAFLFCPSRPQPRPLLSLPQLCPCPWSMKKNLLSLSPQNNLQDRWWLFLIQVFQSLTQSLFFSSMSEESD
ncbi:hypothetical protein JOB18_043847 [Solea senegalensis]|uniref:Uncharacterized protein n=1 Tax=Solea senegalensis TaxID=28829 RepID=A0AAV6QHA2_SOLSE|nr:hypothetical protein JOB18_043847 [Solea senegalensis]